MCCPSVQVRSIVLRRKHAYTMSFWMLPIMVFITVWVNVYFVLTKVRPINTLLAGVQARLLWSLVRQVHH